MASSVVNTLRVGISLYVSDFRKRRISEYLTRVCVKILVIRVISAKFLLHFCYCVIIINYHKRIDLVVNVYSSALIKVNFGTLSCFKAKTRQSSEIYFLTYYSRKNGSISYWNAYIRFCRLCILSYYKYIFNIISQHKQGNRREILKPFLY